MGVIETMLSRWDSRKKGVNKDLPIYITKGKKADRYFIHNLYGKRLKAKLRDEVDFALDGSYISIVSDTGEKMGYDGIARGTNEIYMYRDPKKDRETNVVRLMKGTVVCVGSNMRGTLTDISVDAYDAMSAYRINL